MLAALTGEQTVIGIHHDLIFFCSTFVFHGLSDRPSHTFSPFADRLDTLCRLYGDMEEKKWLDNQEVCLLLKVSPRTLQTLRDNGTLAYKQICHKTYNKPGDVESIIRIVEERRKRACNKSYGRSVYMPACHCHAGSAGFSG